MGRREENQGFVCAVCGEHVQPLTDGSYRNHCPECLYSMHLDRTPGDRSADCGGMMEPFALHRGRKRFQVEHRCIRCGLRRLNRVAEHTVQPDNIDELGALAARSLRDPRKH